MPEIIVPGFVHAIQQNSRTAIIAGVVLLISGMLAVAAPFAVGISITVLVGFLLAIGGVSQCLLAFKAGAFGRGLLIFIPGLLTTIVGIFLVNQPLEGLEAITLLLAAYFIAVGIFELFTVTQMTTGKSRLWMLFNAVITLVLGIMIWQQFPVSGTWALGLLFGVKLLMSGWALIGIATAARALVR